jgi:Kef-type K+ transport system membrane component KefB
MFALGFEESSSAFLRSIKRSWGIAFFGALVPFIVAYSLIYQRWEDTNAALMCGLAMTATAVSLTMVSLRSEGLGKTAAGDRWECAP